MIGLRTARVVIIDDNPAEAFPIIHALGRLGIGTVYVGGKVEHLPERPFTGIRLAFVDMKLDIEGEAKQVIPYTINVLKHVIGETATPTVIAIWTKHQELVSHFKKALKKHLPSLRPGVIVQLNKPFNFENESWPYELPKGDRIMREVTEAMHKHPPLELLWYWEQTVHEAAGQTSTALSNLVEGTGQQANANVANSTHWCNSMTNVLGAVVNAVGGATISDGKSALRAMFSGMNPILFDRVAHIEHADKAIQKSSKGLAEQATAEWDRRGSFLSAAERGSVNKMLFLEPVDPNRRLSPQPGNLYMKEHWDETVSIPFPIGKSKLRRSNIVKGVAKLPNPKGMTGSARASKRKERAKILRKSHAFLLELTPPCDFAQQKAKMARCVVGLLLPVTVSLKDGHPQYLRSLGPIHLDQEDAFPVTGSFEVVLDARYVFGFYLDDIAKQKAVCRLRSEPLQDVISWFASYASRLGHVSL